jgi:hypothetical protein
MSPPQGLQPRAALLARILACFLLVYLFELVYWHRRNSRPWRTRV